MSLTALVVVNGDGSALHLTRALDSVVRQTERPTSVVVAGTKNDSVTSAAAARVGAVVEVGASVAEAINRVASAFECEWLLIVPPGFRLGATCIERCAETFQKDPSAAVIFLSIRLTSPDERFSTVVSFPKASFVDLAADPRRAAPVFAVRRTWWVASGGLDPSTGIVADYDLQLRLAINATVVSVADALAARDVLETVGWPHFDSSDYRESLRVVVDKHRQVIEPVLAEVLVAQEEAYARLRVAHRSLVNSRDRDAARLVQLRTDISHQTASFASTGYTAFDWGDFRRLHPVSRNWGYDRGGPIDRHYIEAFLESQSSEIFGRVLEVQEDDFTCAYGGLRVTQADVLDLNDVNPRATVIADLRWAPHVPSNCYDCIILTQTLHVIDDMRSVLKECFRILKPGGTLLATFPAASRVCLEYGEDGDFWRLTPAGVMALLQPIFGVGAVQITPYGNVQSSVAFLHGLGRKELRDDELDAYDPYYPAITGARVTRIVPSYVARLSRPRGVVLLYHRIEDEGDVHSLNVSVANFAAQLEWLASNCTVMPLERLLGTPIHDLPERPVALTFDDGYLDNLREAAPTLGLRGVPATFFLTTRWLHEQGEYWWDLLERAFGRNWNGAPEIALHLSDRAVSFPCGTAEERVSSHDQLHRELVSAPLEVRERVVAALSAAVGPPGGSRRPLLADEIRQLASMPGVTIGAHTVNHLSLTHQNDATVRSEARESRGSLASIIGRSITLLAYPYGAVDRRVAEILRPEYGWCVTCETVGVSSSFNTTRVPRIEIRDEGAGPFAARIEAAFGDRPPELGVWL